MEDRSDTDDERPRLIPATSEFTHAVASYDPAPSVHQPLSSPGFFDCLSKSLPVVLPSSLSSVSPPDTLLSPISSGCYEFSSTLSVTAGSYSLQAWSSVIAASRSTPRGGCLTGLEAWTASTIGDAPTTMPGLEAATDALGIFTEKAMQLASASEEAMSFASTPEEAT